MSAADPIIRHKALAKVMGVCPCTLSRWVSEDRGGIRSAQWSRGKYLRTKLAALGIDTTEQEAKS